MCDEQLFVDDAQKGDLFFAAFAREKLWIFRNFHSKGIFFDIISPHLSKFRQTHSFHKFMSKEQRPC